MEHRFRGSSGGGAIFHLNGENWEDHDWEVVKGNANQSLNQITEADLAQMTEAER